MGLHLQHSYLRALPGPKSDYDKHYCLSNRFDPHTDACAPHIGACALVPCTAWQFRALSGPHLGHCERCVGCQQSQDCWSPHPHPKDLHVRHNVSSCHIAYACCKTNTQRTSGVSSQATIRLRQAETADKAFHKLMAEQVFGRSVWPALSAGELFLHGMWRQCFLMVNGHSPRLGWCPGE